MTVDRRSFLQFLGSAAAVGTFSDILSKALSISPSGRTGSIADVEHIVILMQENRSFDHYFGTLNGVRGYGDPRAVSLPSGNSVWYQPNASGGYTLPFHPPASNLGLQFIGDLPHDWITTHDAWNQGKYDQWVPSKGALTMAHLTRADIPFHYALADAFTICDAYHCSVMGPTFPNRHHMWTGWTGNDGNQGGPALTNSSGFSWRTFPEQLEQAGISWRVYQDVGQGLDADHSWGKSEDPYAGNYGCNTLLTFDQYQNAGPGSPLFENARTGTNVSAGDNLFDLFRRDILQNNFPQVSWIVPPEAFSEHPNWPANYGAWYVSQILDALTANPAVWSKTAFFLTYDENDGFFDHVVPPTAPQRRDQGLSDVALIDEIFRGNSEFPGGPYGLGVRVPMIVISPWSKGGWVNSELFDHTSMIRFIQGRFGRADADLGDSNITPWRTAVAGDLTSAFRFVRCSVEDLTLPSTATYAPQDASRHPDYFPTPPLWQAMPSCETGTRLASGLPYRINSCGAADFMTNSFSMTFANSGLRAAVFQVRSGSAPTGPWSYTVPSHSQIEDSWQLAANHGVSFDFSVYGPNGFYRAYKGGSDPMTSVNLQSAIAYDFAAQGVILQSRNIGTESCEVQISDFYNSRVHHSSVLTRLLEPGQLFERFWPLDATFGWYHLIITVESDPAFRQQLAGHLETGVHSRTDPAIGVETHTTSQRWSAD